LPSSATRAIDPSRIVGACAAAANELAETRRLVEVLEAENRLLRERLAVSKRLEDGLSALNETRDKEAATLRKAIEAGERAIREKDAAIEKQEEMIAELKRRKNSPWKKVGYILVGIAAASILK